MLLAAPATARTGLTRLRQQQRVLHWASCIDVVIEATTKEAIKRKSRVGFCRFVERETNGERRNSPLLLLDGVFCIFDAPTHTLKRFFPLSVDRKKKRALLLSVFPPPFAFILPLTMRVLVELTICILALALVQVAAREVAGLRRLSAPTDELTTPASSTRSGVASKSTLPEITLYGEALCPDTAAFVSRILGPLLDAGAIAKSGAKGGSGAGKSKSTTSPAALTPSSLSTWSVSSPPLASLPGGGFLSAHSGGPAPTALAPGDTGTVTINSASSSSDYDAAAATFRFVPWGKAKRSPEGKVTCQHGPKECELNKLLGCAQVKQPERYPTTLRCYFASLGKTGGGTPAALEKCVADESLFAKISACASGAEGAALEAAAGKETLETQKALTFVPWVVVDGKQLGSECGAALRAACESAKAKGISPLAPACSRLPELTTDDCPGAP